MKKYYEVNGEDRVLEVEATGIINVVDLEMQLNKKLSPTDAYTYRKWHREKEKQVCRVCGCTYFTPCPGGCYWVEDDLCSTCAEKMRNSL